MTTDAIISSQNESPLPDDTQGHIDFFQQRLTHLLTYWRDHDAVQQLNIAVLDRERTVIIKVINLGLDMAPRWCLARPLIISLTPYMERRGHWDEWHTILERAIVVAQRKGDVKTETTLTSLLARLHQRMSRQAEVIKNYRRVIRLAKATDNRFEKARACSNLGYLYIDGGKWWRSEVLSKHALEIFEELGSDHGRAHTHNHLGVLYRRQSKWHQSEHHLQEASSIWRRTGDDHGLMRVHGNLSQLYNDIEQPLAAIEHAGLALKLATQAGEESLLGTFLFNLAVGYRQQGNINLAHECAKKAESVFLKFEERMQLPFVWHQLALIYLQSGQLSDAHLFKAQALSGYEQYQFQLDASKLEAEFTNLQRTV